MNTCKLFKAIIIPILLFVSLLCISCTSFAQDAEPLFTINYGEKCSGTVNGTNCATVTKNYEADGEVCAKIVPNTVDPSSANLVIDCFNLAYTGEELAKAKYATVKYKYIAPDGKCNAEKMVIRIMKNGDALDTSTYFTATRDHVVGEWTYAYFDLSSISGKVNTAGTFRQIHLYPFGANISPTMLSEKEEILVSEIAFWAENPDENPQYKISFLKGNPDAQGSTPEAFLSEPGKSYTLPENPYIVEDAVFVGWKSSVDGIVYKQGTQMVCGNENVTYTAIFESVIVSPDVRFFSLTTYQGGIVNHYDTAQTSVVTIDDASCVKIVPNPETSKPDNDITLDTFFSQADDSIDIGEYSYVAVRYYIDGVLPRDTKFCVRIMRNGNILTESTYFTSTDNIVCGKWAYAICDIRDLKSKLVPELSEHLLKQVHIYPAYGIKAKEFTGAEAIYLEKIIFFKEKPELTVHEKYINGYKGGLFKPNGNITRAEACAIVARLSAGSDEFVPTDKTTSFSDVKANEWYYKYVSYVEALGYLKNYSGNFEPNKAITRAEFVELVYYMGLLNDKGLNGVFTDVNTNHPKASVISAAGKAGLVNGYDNGDGSFSFMPDKTITRAEVVIVINNALSRNIDSPLLSPDVKYSFNDVSKDFWAYPNIMEASLTHLENKGTWAYSITSPISVIGGEDRVDISKGNEYLQYIDNLTETRISEIREAPTSVSVFGTKYYVSNSGDDANDGKTPETAWKTIAKVNSVALNSGDGVFFKRGDLFRERLKTSTGVTYSAYGKGDKPKIYGSPEDGADKSKWTLMEGTSNIWIYYEKLPDVGMVVLDGNIGYKEIPDWYKGEYYVRDSMGTELFDIKKALNKNLDFFSEIRSDNLNTPATLYLRCDDGNPGEVYGNIEFATKGNVISVQGFNITIDNICVMYGGSHGIGSGTTENLTVTNCEVGMIGGSLLRLYPDKFGQVVRYGNGVEIYGGCDGYTIDNCYVYQCYDAGVTHQYDNGGLNNISMYNITYSNNVIERCVYSIEYFNGTGDNDNVIRDGKNYKIIGNILRLAGYGWGQQRPNPGASTHIQGGTSRNEYEKGTYIIENNIFDRGLDSLVRSGAGHKAWAPIYRNNTYIQSLGMPLGKTVGTNTLIYDYVADITIAESLGDVNASVYWVD